MYGECVRANDKKPSVNRAPTRVVLHAPAARCGERVALFEVRTTAY